MNTTGVTEGPYITLKEETAGQLSGKEGYLVELGTAEDTCKILATAANAIGTYEGRLSADSEYVRIRLLGQPGTARFVANGVIAKGGKFIAAAGGKVAPVGSAGSGIVLGRSLYQGNTADDQRFLAIPHTVEHKAAESTFIADPSGGATQDAEARSAINDILDVLIAHDLMAAS
jgi:hypothetical protein